MRKSKQSRSLYQSRKSKNIKLDSFKPQNKLKIQIKKDTHFYCPSSTLSARKHFSRDAFRVASRVAFRFVFFLSIVDATPEQVINP